MTLAGYRGVIVLPPEGAAIGGAVLAMLVLVDRLGLDWLENTGNTSIFGATDLRLVARQNDAGQLVRLNVQCGGWAPEALRTALLPAVRGAVGDMARVVEPR